MADKNTADDLLSIDHVASEILHCSPYTVRRMIKSGHIPAIRIGGRMIRIRRSDLDAAMKPVETAR